MTFDLNLKHLEYFLAVAKLGSINKAAQTLYISQPYLGKIITELETRLGTVLLQRTRSGIVLTPDGSRFLARASAIVRETEKLQELFGQTPASTAPLMVSTTKFSHIMNCFIDTVRAHEEEDSFSHQLNEGSAEEVIDDVFSGRANVGVIHFDSSRAGELKAGLPSKGLIYHFISYIRPHIIISKSHPLILAERPVNLDTLAGYGLARYTGQFEDFTYKISCANTYYNLNCRPKIVYLSDRASLLHMISESDFYSIGIHDFSGQESIYNIRSIPVEDCSSMLEFGYLLPVKTVISEITKEFIEGVTARLKSL